MDRHLHILQVHQKGICETLSVMESEAELLRRYSLRTYANWNQYIYYEPL